MAKLTRWTMPVFAGSAAQDETSVFGTMKTSPEYTSDVAAAIDTQAYNNGWTDAVEIGYAPFLEDMNSLQRAITYQISYNQQQGIPEWASDTEYYKGSVVKLNTANGMQIYSSLVDNNVGNLVSDNTKWKLLIDSANSYVTTNTAQTISGTKTFATPVANKVGGTYSNYATGNQTYMNINAYDSTNKLTGFVDCYTRTDGTTETRLITFDANNPNKYSWLASQVDANGNALTSAPTPAFNSNDNNIATTAWVKNLFATLFPVGSIYITTQNTGTCPLASIISGSQWELVATDRALWGGNGWNAHSWIAAGLPNITGSHGGADTNSRWVNGCFYDAGDVTSGGGHGGGWAVGFDASRSSSIYGQSSTVQPPAYRVNVWRRIA